MSQKDMILSMIDKGLTLPSNATGGFKTFKQLSAVQIYNLVRQCAEYSKLDLEYSNEPLQYIMYDARIVLVSATAGAGKTTLTCNKIDREIRLRGTNPRTICMLSFNNDSVADIKRKMQHVVNNNNLVTRRFGIMLEERDMPNIRSLNSLTYNLVDQYKDYWNLGSLNIITNEDANILMSKVVNAIADDMKSFEVSENLIANCLSIYDLLNETCKSVYDLKNNSLILDTGVSPDVIDRIIASYKSHLHVDNKFHHSDTARLVLERCEIDEDFRHIVENLYELIVVDELQDISESVFRLIKIMVNTKNRLIAIGDGDQAIYGFKGSRPDTCFKFKEDFPDAVLCTLSVNRRCSEEILNYAKCVINSLNKRIPQELKAIRPGGIVDIHHYGDSTEAIKDIAAYLRDIPKDILGKMCIGFRKNVTCYYIAQKLMEEGIPFRVRPEMMPGQDKLSQHLKGIFAMLKSPTNLDLAFQSLYKVSAIKKITEKEKEKLFSELEDYMDENDLEYFYELPAEVLPVRYGKQRLIADQFKILEQASTLVRKRGTMREVMELIYKQFEDSYWTFTRAVTSFQQELEDMVRDIYSKDETYIEFQCRKKEMEDNIQRYISKGYGIKLSSFHSLKGLEFNEVFLVELDGKNLPLLRVSETMSDAEISDLIDEELRLFYVAVTRARDKLHLYWSITQPSTVEQINTDYLKITSNINVDDIDTTIEFNDDVTGDISWDTDSQTDSNIDDMTNEDDLIDVDVNLDFDNSTSDNATTDLFSSDDDIEVDLSSEINVDLSELEVNMPTSDLANKIKEDIQQVPKESKVSQEKLTSDIINESVNSFHQQEAEETIHLREDFVDVKNGDQLQNVLGFICKVIDTKEVSK
jgi:DNA helicase-2/ATP-dependent DNA helicase PcrA